MKKARRYGGPSFFHVGQNKLAQGERVDSTEEVIRQMVYATAPR